ncbi:hypothetical protein [Streptomyces sp. NPDC088184]|uniref:hypothetical protein n=1 Tax=Streptomyces sp. NPDC088184 TaxID=3160991 RepID=UPI0034462491
MTKVGLVVNPVAGLGGRVGLGGTDGPDRARTALALGARPLAPGLMPPSSCHSPVSRPVAS